MDQLSFQIDMQVRRVTVKQKSSFEVAFGEALEQCQVRKLLSKEIETPPFVTKMFPSGFCTKLIDNDS